MLRQTSQRAVSSTSTTCCGLKRWSFLGLIVCLLWLPASAFAQSDWDVPPQHEAPDASWDVTNREVSGPDPSWDVTPRATEPGTQASDRSASADAAEEREASGRTATGFHASAVASFDRQRFTLRLTPWLGVRETISLSFAWTKPEFFEFEAGIFLNPYARVQTRTTEALPGGEVLEWSVNRRVLEKGFYVRGSIAYPLFDQRGVRMRPWHANVLIPLELRVPVRASMWTVVAALHVGAEFTRWFNSGRGLSLGGTVGAPFWDLRARQSLSFRPILRFHIGLAF